MAWKKCPECKRIDVPPWSRNQERCSFCQQKENGRKWDEAMEKFRDKLK